MARKNQIVLFAGNFAPVGWSYNSELFASPLVYNSNGDKMKYIYSSVDSVTRPFIGEIRIFTGNFAPKNWLFCNGEELSINQHTVLYSIFGVTYGGNGATNFCIPKMNDLVSGENGVCRYIICIQGEYPRRPE